MDMELSRFKSEINLAAYAAAAHGYELDHRESSHASMVMRRGWDKIIVATDKDGHGIYFSVRDPSDHGSIIDFVQRRRGLNLGQVRKELRPWLPGAGTSFPYRPHQLEIKKPEPTAHDRQQVVKEWLSMMTALDHPYLIKERGISAAVLSDPRFVGVVKIDKFGNAVFPHFDDAGVCGFELKNKNFSGFSKGGTKGIWRTVNINTAISVVATESSIDSISHAQLFPDRDAAYLSTGGALSGRQREVLAALFSFPNIEEIVIASDNDEAGHKLAEEIAGLVPAGGKARPRREIPVSGVEVVKDWNDKLRLEGEGVSQKTC